MAACLIFKRPLKVIFKPPPENAKTQGKRPFSDVHVHFHDNPASLTGEHRERPNSCSNEAPSVGSHSVEPRPPLRIARRVDHPE
jgi:hypothetical protein